MSKQYAHLYTMAKTSVKFQNDWPKTVGGVALTRHPLTIRVLGKKKTTKLTKQKKLKKKNLRIMSKQYAHLHAMAKTPVKFQNDWPKIVGGVVLTSQLLTNGQTRRVTARLYRTCVLTQVRQKTTFLHVMSIHQVQFIDSKTNGFSTSFGKISFTLHFILNLILCN